MPKRSRDFAAPEDPSQVKKLKLSKSGDAYEPATPASNGGSTSLNQLQNSPRSAGFSPAINMGNPKGAETVVPSFDKAIEYLSECQNSSSVNLFINRDPRYGLGDLVTLRKRRHSTTSQSSTTNSKCCRKSNPSL